MTLADKIKDIVQSINDSVSDMDNKESIYNLAIQLIELEKTQRTKNDTLNKAINFAVGNDNDLEPSVEKLLDQYIKIVARDIDKRLRIEHILDDDAVYKFNSALEDFLHNPSPELTTLLEYTGKTTENLQHNNRRLTVHELCSASHDSMTEIEKHEAEKNLGASGAAVTNL